MKNKHIVLGLLASASLVGCGGSSDSGSSKSGSFVGDGIYLNSSDFAVMIVDSTRTENPLAVGDFANDSVYFVDSATTTGNTMVTKGITVSDSTVTVSLSEQEMTATFTDSQVTLTAVIDDANLIYSMDKTAASLPLAQIVGTHTNPDDGSTWTINADGSFTVNGICTISGTLQRNGDYFNVNATATACASSSFNGAYTGAFLTVKYNGTDYIAGLLGNETSLMWGHAPKS
ncbi:hypothetical protein [Photobacterium atrarenae]|uniref:Lipoprotein n=1 Tax=Photobacterium atrarenae TaxID=865757 RepID=A0ABY5GGJ5_9GAMM|nr:hypothetical protein [Photobacterium atrarenae]UTV27493.1 hypothetical protein NNL38_14450 [Photobacterium atrarenae]